MSAAQLWTIRRLSKLRDGPTPRHGPLAVGCQAIRPLPRRFITRSPIQETSSALSISCTPASSISTLGKKLSSRRIFARNGLSLSRKDAKEICKSLQKLFEIELDLYVVCHLRHHYQHLDVPWIRPGLGCPGSGPSLSWICHSNHRHRSLSPSLAHRIRHHYENHCLG